MKMTIATFFPRHQKPKKYNSPFPFLPLFPPLSLTAALPPQYLEPLLLLQ